MYLLHFVGDLCQSQHIEPMNNILTLPTDFSPNSKKRSELLDPDSRPNCATRYFGAGSQDLNTTCTLLGDGMWTGGTYRAQVRGFVGNLLTHRVTHEAGSKKAIFGGFGEHDSVKWLEFP